MKGASTPFWTIIGIIAVRYIFLPFLGVLIIKGATKLGLVQPDPLYQFMLLLQYALPPAMNIGNIIIYLVPKLYFYNCFLIVLTVIHLSKTLISGSRYNELYITQLFQFYFPMSGTIAQLFGAGESECSVIMLWTYALASVAVTLWSTYFMWLVAWFFLFIAIYIYIYG